MIKKSDEVCHVFHILVKYEYEAQDLLRKIQSFEDFKNLAYKFSICSSAQAYGDLGLQKKNRLEANFLEALQYLKPGQMSKKPVRTQFGYHIIWRVN